MNARTQEEIKKVVAQSNGAGRPLCFRGLALPEGDFSGMDLRSADFRNARLHFAKFCGAGLKYANFESANLCSADFTNADLHRANFKDADLSYSIMKPRDALGLTITLECKSFEGMEVEPGYWYGWLMYALLMKAPSEEARDSLIATMGVERWNVLRRQYAVRVT